MSMFSEPYDELYDIALKIAKETGCTSPTSPLEHLPLHQILPLIGARLVRYKAENGQLRAALRETLDFINDGCWDDPDIDTWIGKLSALIDEKEENVPESKEDPRKALEDSKAKTFELEQRISLLENTIRFVRDHYIEDSPDMWGMIFDAVGERPKETKK